MPLLKNKGQFATYITVSDANNNSGMPKQASAEAEFIIPIVGQELFDTLQTEADGVPTDPSTLLKLACNALAYLAYFKELPFIHGRITDSGLVNTATDKQTPVYRYQYENMLTNLENEGLAGLERLLQYLFENKEDYPEWESSEAYERLNNNLIKTGAEFTNYYHIFQPHRTFYTIQPVMQEVEDFYINNKIGKAFFQELKELATPDQLQASVLDCLRKSIANLTIYKAAIKLSVKVSAEGFTVMLSRNPDRSDQGEENAPLVQLNKLSDDAQRDGNNYLNQALNILQANASAQVFTTFFNSSYYKDPTIKKPNPNDCMNGVFVM